ncbi:hypothetical protein [Woodsholea maritima]|uniref:hypothetical protein n=1 Tax=Woodsholea maritima TaxID=240237 RepID=UPI0003647937|nr:hypothetical protein [Woodsholea maritima]
MAVMKWMRTGLGLTVVTLGLAACGHSNYPPYEPPYTPVGEAVYGWRLEANGDLVVRVRSSGCTNDASFEPYVEGGPGWDFDVELIRIHEDLCEAFFPNGVEVTYTRDDLGLPPGARLRLINPVQR